jgi:hypothetical protein
VPSTLCADAQYYCTQHSNTQFLVPLGWLLHFVVMLSGIILSVIILSVIMLSVIMLSVIMLSAIMLNVMLIVVETS